jgi:hypothetical protein
MRSCVYSIRHDQKGLVGTTLDVVLQGLIRFPPGRYLVYRSGGGSWWSPHQAEVCGVAVHHGDGHVELKPADRTPQSLAGRWFRHA